ncbi:MAG: phosphohydrolase [Deltaproteobacteria bacterium RIFCSPLOWO2_01_FULL_42_9]|nr:MAG: phosphohydrolase [Deltaproteobacteria bacterium RIFCSPLOWO2_01_FULL_42_9]
MLNEKQKLMQIINLGLEVAQVKDIDLLLERILTEARHFVNADAGSIYIKEDHKLMFSYTQNETPRQKLPAGRKLIYSTFSIPINDKSIAGYVALTGKTLNIENVYKLPEDVSYSFDKRYDEVSEYRTQSMLAFPLKTHRGDVIGVLQLINAQDKNKNIKPFNKEDEPLIMHFANNAAMAVERALMTRAIILRMIRMAELRDPKETGAHVNRVASYSVEIYEAWALKRGISQKEIDKNKDVLRMAAMLHDVGKVAISDVILKKPAKLDMNEIEVMKQHTYLGARLFSDKYSDFDEAASQVALNHHERWDGNGYPGYIDPITVQPISDCRTEKGAVCGKKGEEIPLFGRIVAVADVYDALCSRRAYKEPWDESRILENLHEERGKQFDPEMIDAFFLSLDVIRSAAERYPDK